MEVLQVELNEVKENWNTHLMQNRRGGVSGIPDELYNIPDIHGFDIHYNKYVVKHSLTQGLKIALATLMMMTCNFCKIYTSTEPAPAGIKFLQLIKIIMEEEDWLMPSNYEQALELYFNLLNEIEF